MSQPQTAHASAPEPGTTPPPQGAESELHTWSTWLSQAAEAGSDFAALFALELRLAAGDTGRLLMLMVMAIPLLLLSWLGLTVLIAWLIGDYLNSVGWGLGTFLLLHLAALAGLVCLWQRYKRSLKLPRSRQYLQAFMGGFAANETRSVDSRNSGP